MRALQYVGVLAIPAGPDLSPADGGGRVAGHGILGLVRRLKVDPGIHVRALQAQDRDIVIDRLTELGMRPHGLDLDTFSAGVEIGAADEDLRLCWQARRRRSARP